MSAEPRTHTLPPADPQATTCASEPTATAPVELQPPARRYAKLSLHAEGGLGAVYLARDEELGRTVALKEIQPRHADSPAAARASSSRRR